MTDQLPVPLDLAELGINARATYAVPAVIAAAGEHARVRFLEFFAANIRNSHTRRAYGRAVAGTAVQPLHVAAWIEAQTREHAAPRVNPVHVLKQDKHRPPRSHLCKLACKCLEQMFLAGPPLRGRGRAVTKAGHKSGGQIRVFDLEWLA